MCSVNITRAARRDGGACHTPLCQSSTVQARMRNTHHFTPHIYAAPRRLKRLQRGRVSLLALPAWRGSSDLSARGGRGARVISAARYQCSIRYRRERTSAHHAEQGPPRRAAPREYPTPRRPRPAG
ncbi:unnamed protein product [Chrysodeixis includens]|uniref:Uncharacterized protein n=1 Tax=Chrysodeixis includens TaxID=689277 RepID=A0A9N8L0Y8_CHRIL|nr:unnamed protein product [Chrysodeixis includens]